ncbi:MAG: enoyl-CoA hydratase/isomerase family protein [Candidatus Melainabacteria bacterium]|nr:enoyl-CoA hydratase/isomerase family protein [Candidatus Melainabacteria bacterium]
MTTQITFDERLSKLPFLRGVERAQQFKGKNKSVILGASGTMGADIVNATTKAGSGTFRQDIDLESLESSKTNIVRTQAKAVKVHKLSERQQRHINRAGLIGPPIVFNQREPFSKITEAHKEGRAEAEKIVKGFLGSAITDSKVRKDYGETTLVIEAGPELLSFKQNVFEFFDLALKKGAVLASNTSFLSVSEIAKRVDNPENVVGFHFFKPADRNPLVEIIATEKTSLEVIEAMRQLAYAMGKQPIVCWKDTPGAVANRIYVGVLNEAAKIAEEWKVSSDSVDQVFKKIFYDKQINVKTKKAKTQFKEAITLAFFNDEVGTYKKIKAIDDQIKIASNKGYKGQKILDKLFEEKLALLKDAIGELNQKKMYAGIVENSAKLGSFFKPAKRTSEAKEKATKQLEVVGKYLMSVKKNKDNLILPFTIEPYTLTEAESNKQSGNETDEQRIAERLLAAYSAIAIEIVNEGLSDIHDVEIACKQGFKWNIGPFEFINKLGVDNACELIASRLTETSEGNSGIALSPNFEITDDKLSGVKSYIQDGIGFLELGRLHIQNLQQMQNSMGPEMLRGIKQALGELKERGARAVVFKDQGGGVFSSGADLSYAQSVKEDPEKLKEFVLLGKEVMKTIRNFELPTLALIDGPAVGGGAELASACDYRIMVDEESYIAFPEVGLGLDPEWMGTEYFPEIVGKKLAKAMICNVRNPLAAPKLTASDAKEVGFANAVVSRPELYPFLAEVIKGNTEIDLSRKPERKQNFDKNNYSDKIREKFGLKKGFKHRWGFFTTRKNRAKETEKLIDNSHDPEYAEKYRNEEFYERLRMSFIKIDKKIQRIVKAAQSGWLAPILEKFGII